MLDDLPIGNTFQNIPDKIDSIKTGRVIKSEIALPGAFICKILVKSIRLLRYCSSELTAGIIADNSNKSVYYDYDNYERYSHLYTSLGYTLKQKDKYMVIEKDKINNLYETENDKKIGNGEEWKNGDYIIIKRDMFNNLYFGLNNENSLTLASQGIVGTFNIVIGVKQTL